MKKHLGLARSLKDQPAPRVTGTYDTQRKGVGMVKGNWSFKEKNNVASRASGKPA